jgi:hypothetical protein
MYSDIVSTFPSGCLAILTDSQAVYEEKERSRCLQDLSWIDEHVVQPWIKLGFVLWKGKRKLGYVWDADPKPILEIYKDEMASQEAKEMLKQARMEKFNMTLLDEKWNGPGRIMWWHEPSVASLSEALRDWFNKRLIDNVSLGVFNPFEQGIKKGIPRLPIAFLFPEVHEKKKERRGTKRKTREEKLPLPVLPHRHPSFQALARLYQNLSKNKILPTPTLSDIGTISTKKQLVEQILNFCKDTHTPVMHEEFQNMPYRDLKRLRVINNHCFTLEEIFQILKRAMESNQPVRDPLTRQIWNQPLREEILKQYQEYVKKGAQIQKPQIEFDEKNVELVFEPEEVNNHLFHHIGIRILPDRVLDLGYIPEYTNPRDTSENTGVLLATLRQLWDQRRLLLVHSPNAAVSCCTIHLGKFPDYWIDQEGRINGRLIHSMLEEMKDKLE